MGTSSSKRAEYNLRYRTKNANKIKSYRNSHADELNKKKRDNYQANKEEVKIKNAKYRQDNPEKVKSNNAKYRKENSEKVKDYLANYRKENMEKSRVYMANYQKNRKKDDFIYKLRTNISSLVRMSFKNIGSKKSLKTEQILGCSLLEFDNYIKSKMELWMNNENYGVYKPGGKRTWNIDHVIPLATAKTVEDVLKLNHYSNLRPLCSKENLEKRNNLLNQ